MCAICFHFEAHTSWRLIVFVCSKWKTATLFSLSAEKRNNNLCVSAVQRPRHPKYEQRHLVSCQWCYSARLSHRYHTTHTAHARKTEGRLRKQSQAFPSGESHKCTHACTFIPKACVLGPLRWQARKITSPGATHKKEEGEIRIICMNSPQSGSREERWPGFNELCAQKEWGLPHAAPV